MIEGNPWPHRPKIKVSCEDSPFNICNHGSYRFFPSMYEWILVPMGPKVWTCELCELLKVSGTIIALPGVPRHQLDKRFQVCIFLPKLQQKKKEKRKKIRKRKKWKSVCILNASSTESTVPSYKGSLGKPMIIQ